MEKNYIEPGCNKGNPSLNQYAQYMDTDNSNCGYEYFEKSIK